MFGKLPFFLSLIFISFSSHAQTCELKILGKVVDKNSLKPIEFASVYVEELERGTVSDFSGNCEIKNLCPGEYHIVVRHIGCETQNVLFTLTSDTLWTVYVEHGNQLLNEVTVENHAQESKSQELEVLSSKDINRQLWIFHLRRRSHRTQDTIRPELDNR